MFACVHAKKGNLFSLASSFSPVVEQTAPDTVVFSIAGLERLMGTPHEIASEICRQGAALGIVQGNLAIAHNPDTAVLLAGNIRGVTIVPAGQEAEYLAELPIEAILADFQVLETLTCWGVRTLGALANLPEIGLAERFGQKGVLLRRLASGQTKRILRPALPRKKFEKRIELDYSVEQLDQLLFVISSILHELTGDLNRHGLAANRLNLFLELENDSHHQRSQEFAMPLREPQMLLKIVQVDLENHPPRAAIVAVRIELHPVPPQTLQHGFFTPSHPAPQKLQLALTRIAGLVGEHNVGSALLLNTYRPDAFSVKTFRPPKSVDTAPVPSNRFLQIAFRIYRPALPAGVRTKDDRPMQIAAAGIRGNVLTASGPWRSSGEWWADTHWDRDEWDIDLSNGGVYRIYCRRDSRDWFVEGVYD
jgi:protein ImuB